MEILGSLLFDLWAKPRFAIPTLLGIAAGVAMGTLFAADPPLRVDASSSSDAGSSRTDVRAIRSAARELEPPSFSAALPSTGIHGIPATAQMSAWRPM